MHQKSAGSNHEGLAGRIALCDVKRGRRVTKKRHRPALANTEVEGRMADTAMLTRLPPMAIESWASAGSAMTCAPVLVTG